MTVTQTRIKNLITVGEKILDQIKSEDDFEVEYLKDKIKCSKLLLEASLVKNQACYFSNVLSINLNELSNAIISYLIVYFNDEKEKEFSNE